ncbi:hypothetical protein E2C01_071422 [Portunus trituberculatus]|uniref:Uncharacterized protein n=1 Tax=Portunus trituberculatus TaxID=210409 RepID=A0A5B7I4E6_PORTR|nr:hypothetical protein [Portunus trituberculatus]
MFPFTPSSSCGCVSVELLRCGVAEVQATEGDEEEGEETDSSPASGISSVAPSVYSFCHPCNLLLFFFVTPAEGDEWEQGKTAAEGDEGETMTAHHQKDHQHPASVARSGPSSRPADAR